MLAAKAGATFISPFVGRLDDVGTDGMALIADIVQIYDAYPAITTEVLVASVRHPIHVIEAAKMGAHVATLPPGVLRQMFNHPLTDKGLAAFLADWAEDRPVDPLAACAMAEDARRRPHRRLRAATRGRCRAPTRVTAQVVDYLRPPSGIPGAPSGLCSTARRCRRAATAKASSTCSSSWWSGCGATSRKLRTEQDDLLANSRDNLSTQDRVHKAVLALLAAKSFEQFIEIVTTDLAVLLDVDVVTLCVESDRSPKAPLTEIDGRACAAAGRDRPRSWARAPRCCCATMPRATPADLRRRRRPGALRCADPPQDRRADRRPA